MKSSQILTVLIPNLLLDWLPHTVHELACRSHSEIHLEFSMADGHDVRNPMKHSQRSSRQVDLSTVQKPGGGSNPVAKYTQHRFISNASGTQAGGDFSGTCLQSLALAPQSWASRDRCGRSASNS